MANERNPSQATPEPVKINSLYSLNKMMVGGMTNLADSLTGIIYRLSYDVEKQHLRMNDRIIYYARSHKTHLVLKSVFAQQDTTKEVSYIVDNSGERVDVNTESTKGNIQRKSGIPRSLWHLFKSTNKSSGMKIITVVRVDDITEEDITDVNTWLATKKQK